MNFTSSAWDTWTQDHIKIKLEKPGLWVYQQKTKKWYYTLIGYLALGCKDNHWASMKTLFPSLLVYLYITGLTGDKLWDLSQWNFHYSGPPDCSLSQLCTLTAPQRRTLCQAPPDIQPPGDSSSLWVCSLPFPSGRSPWSLPQPELFPFILERRDQCVNDRALSQVYYCMQLRFKETKLLAGGHEYQGE